MCTEIPEVIFKPKELHGLGLKLAKKILAKRKVKVS